MPTLTATATAERRSRTWSPPTSDFDFDFDDGVERIPNAEMLETLEDVRLWRNISGPFATVEEAMRDMLED